MNPPSAFSSQLPSAVVHPGPLSNRWVGEEIIPDKNPACLRLGELVRTLGWGENFHLNLKTGKPTAIRRRGAPSGGGSYPLQWHIVCGEGFDLPAGRYVLNPDTGAFTRRELLSGEDMLSFGQARVTLTALPRRTAARYHHRSAPVIIGDAAYSAEIFCAGALGLGLYTAISTESASTLAHSAALPHPQQWQQVWPATATEIALLAIDVAQKENKLPGISKLLDTVAAPLAFSRSILALPPMVPEPSWVPGIAELGVEHSRPAPEPSPVLLTLEQIRQRRSPQPIQLMNREKPNTNNPLGPWCSQQNWIDRCANIILYYADSSPLSQWQMYHRAAQDLVKLLSQSIQSRPVSGWTHGNPHGKISHALVYADPSREHTSYDR